MGFRAWCENTSCHGFADFIAAKGKGMKVVWAVVIMLFLAVMTFQVYHVLYHYIQSEKWGTRIYESQEDVGYPVISVCNYNRLRKSKMFGMTKGNKTMGNNIMRMFLTSFVSRSPYSSSVEQDIVLQDFSRWRKEMGFGYKQTLNKAGTSCNSSLLHLSVGGRVETENCTDQAEIQFESFLDPEFGKCFKIILTPRIRNVLLPGSRAGVTLILDVKPEEYPEFVDGTFLDEGMAIQISTNGASHFGNWINVSPGYHSWIGLKRKQSTLVKDMWNLYEPPCQEHPTLPVRKDKYFSMANCFVDCDLATYRNVCGCVPFLESDKGDRICELEEVSACKAKQQKARKDHVPSCKAKHCQEPCESSDFDTTLSFTRFPSGAQASKLLELWKDHLPKKITVEEFKTRAAAIDIYYQSLATTVTEQKEVMTVDSLIGSLGGHMGLWAGMSLMSIIQALLYLCSGLAEKLPRPKVIVSKGT